MMLPVNSNKIGITVESYVCENIENMTKIQYNTNGRTHGAMPIIYTRKCTKESLSGRASIEKNNE